MTNCACLKWLWRLAHDRNTSLDFAVDLVYQISRAK